MTQGTEAHIDEDGIIKIAKNQRQRPALGSK